MREIIIFTLWCRNYLDFIFRAQEMSPQAALVEFIATSASYHGVRRQTLTELEDDLFRVSLKKLNLYRGSFNNYVDKMRE